MKFEINIDKRYLIAIIAVIVVAAGIIGVIASHNTGTPNPGHDINSIGGIPTCATGEVLTHDATGIICTPGASTSLGTVGYLEVNGALIQWGKSAGGSGQGQVSVSFPITFTQVYNVQATVDTAWAVDRDIFAQVISVSNSGATLAVQASGGTQSYDGIFWVAIGEA